MNEKHLTKTKFIENIKYLIQNKKKPQKISNYLFAYNFLKKFQKKIHENTENFEEEIEEDEEKDFITTLRSKISELTEVYHIIEFFKTDKNKRTTQSIKTISDYLTIKKPKSFFNKIKSINKELLYNLIKNLNLKHFDEGENIFSIDDYSNYLYILIFGKVEFKKIRFYQKKITVLEFVKYLYDLKYYQKNEKLLNLIIQKNSNIYKNFEILRLTNYNYNDLVDCNLIYNFYIHKFLDEYEISEFTCLNEISLMGNYPECFYTYAKKECDILYLSKSEFQLLLKIMLLKKYQRLLSNYQKNYIIFHTLNSFQTGKILNNVSPMRFIFEDKLIEQNQKDKHFFIILKGNFEIYLNISISMFEKYKKYILDDKNNLINYIDHNYLNVINIENIENYIEKNQENEKYPIQINNNVKNNKILINKITKNNLINLKLNEDKFDKKNNIVYIKLGTISENEIIGFENCFSAKKTFYNVKCISNYGLVQKIYISELLLFFIQNKIPMNNIINFYNNKKEILIKKVEKKIKFLDHINNRNINSIFSQAILKENDINKKIEAIKKNKFEKNKLKVKNIFINKNNKILNSKKNLNSDNLILNKKDFSYTNLKINKHRNLSLNFSHTNDLNVEPTFSTDSNFYNNIKNKNQKISIKNNYHYKNNSLFRLNKFNNETKINHNKIKSFQSFENTEKFLLKMPGIFKTDRKKRIFSKDSIFINYISPSFSLDKNYTSNNKNKSNINLKTKNVIINTSNHYLTTNEFFIKSNYKNKRNERKKLLINKFLK